MNTHGRNPPTHPSIYNTRNPFQNLRNLPVQRQPLPTHVDDYRYVRTQQDVLLVRQILMHLGLPIELALTILETANYFTTLKAQREERVLLSTDISLNYEGTALYLTSAIIPVGSKEYGVTNRPRFVKFNITSSDQGSGGEPGDQGTYKGSWTWFEASILRPITDGEPGNHLNEGPLEVEFPRQPLPKWKTPRNAIDPFKIQGWEMLCESDERPKVWKVQSNMIATREAKEHEIMWVKGVPGSTVHADGVEDGQGDGAGFMDELQEGDRIALWARAMFPSWKNIVRKASIEVGYEEHNLDPQSQPRE